MIYVIIFLFGIGFHYAISCLVYLHVITADKPVGYWIATSLNNAVQIAIPVIFIFVGAAVIGVIFFWWKNRSDKERQQLLDESNKTAGEIKQRAEIETNDYCGALRYQAYLDAENKKKDAYAIYNAAFEEKLVVGKLQQELKDEFNNKKQAYLSQISGLEANNLLLGDKLELQNEIIKWLSKDTPNIGAANRVVKKLRNLEKKRGSLTKQKNEE